MPSKMLNILVTSPKYMIPLFPQKRFNRIKINLSMPNRGQNLLKFSSIKVINKTRGKEKQESCCMIFFYH